MWNEVLLFLYVALPIRAVFDDIVKQNEVHEVC